MIKRDIISISSNQLGIFDKSYEALKWDFLYARESLVFRRAKVDTSKGC